MSQNEWARFRARGLWHWGGRASDQSDWRGACGWQCVLDRPRQAQAQEPPDMQVCVRCLRAARDAQRTGSVLQSLA